ncbi:MAG: hypothetical protein JWQ23_3515, partial [Herminiimonas sp.]|nr:hypothetical protein [Herminiimonas sp.]
ARFKKTGSAAAAACLRAEGPGVPAADSAATTQAAAGTPPATGAASAAGAAPGASTVATAASAPAPVPAVAAAAAAPAAAAPAVAPIPPCQDPGPYLAAQSGAKVGVADSLPVPAAGKPVTAAEAKK